MIPKKSGAIVNIGSYACFFGFPAIAAYCASKGGLAQLTRVLAVENIPHGIRVNASAPATSSRICSTSSCRMDVNFLAHTEERAHWTRGAARRDSRGRGFLASERASFLVARFVMADGGYSVQVGPRRDLSNITGSNKSNHR
jgi:NAD(P)-dependent dehydrogenase (short-subunit alcohol dehydrogenase family)